MKKNPWDDETDARCFLRVDDITITHTRTETTHFNPISKRAMSRGDYGTREATVTLEGAHGPLELKVPVEVANALINYFDRGPKNKKEQMLPSVLIDDGNLHDGG